MTRRKSHLGQKKPLYRKVNTKARGVRHKFGGEARWDRNSKLGQDDLRSRGSMHLNNQGDSRRGLDYTPLFKFLLSRVGDDWDVIYSEAVARLDKIEPIFWMVAKNEAEKKPFFRAGESAFFSGLFVDAENKLSMVDPNLGFEDMEPSCSCCTHTFNGIKFLRPFSTN